MKEKELYILIGFCLFKNSLRNLFSFRMAFEQDLILSPGSMSSLEEDYDFRKLIPLIVHKVMNPSTKPSGADEEEESEESPIPSSGYKCPAPACEHLVFKRKASCQRHWDQFHETEINEYQCSSCSYRQSREDEMRRHVRKHPIKSYKTEVTNNAHYIDPHAPASKKIRLNEEERRPLIEINVERKDDGEKIGDEGS